MLAFQLSMMPHLLFQTTQYESGKMREQGGRKHRLFVAVKNTPIPPAPPAVSSSSPDASGAPSSQVRHGNVSDGRREDSLSNVQDSENVRNKHAWMNEDNGQFMFDYKYQPLARIEELRTKQAITTIKIYKSEARLDALGDSFRLEQVGRNIFAVQEEHDFGSSSSGLHGDASKQANQVGGVVPDPSEENYIAPFQHAVQHEQTTLILENQTKVGADRGTGSTGTTLPTDITILESSSEDDYVAEELYANTLETYMREDSESSIHLSRLYVEAHISQVSNAHFPPEWIFEKRNAVIEHFTQDEYSKWMRQCMQCTFT